MGLRIEAVIVLILLKVDPMSEERTQSPSKRRRQLAREQGQAAHSPELTAAAGWLMAIAALWLCGGGLAGALLGLMRGVGSEWEAGFSTVDPVAVAGRIQRAALAVAWPLGTIVASFAAGAAAAHQLQVRGLWAPRTVLPDVARLWTPGRGSGSASRSRRAAWSAVKAVAFVAVLAWAVRSGWREVLGLGSLEVAGLADRVGRSVLGLGFVLAGMLAVLGLIDFGLSYFRFESMLRTSAEEQREDQRIQEGDLAARSQRRRIARLWRGDSPEELAGASLVIRGSGGLTVVVAGGPPPRRVTIQTTAATSRGLRLRRSAERSRVPHVNDPGLAARLAQHPAGRLPIPAERLSELAAIWPPQCVDLTLDQAGNPWLPHPLRSDRP